MSIATTPAPRVMGAVARAVLMPRSGRQATRQLLSPVPGAVAAVEQQVGL